MHSLSHDVKEWLNRKSHIYFFFPVFCFVYVVNIVEFFFSHTRPKHEIDDVLLVYYEMLKACISHGWNLNLVFEQLEQKLNTN